MSDVKVEKKQTEIQEMLSGLGVCFHFFPKKLEVYAQQGFFFSFFFLLLLCLTSPLFKALLLYQEQLREYEQWEEGEIERREQVGEGRGVIGEIIS